MGVAIFFLMALAVAGAIVYPLLPGPRSAAARPAPAVSTAEIDAAVRSLRRARTGGRLAPPTCAACGTAYQPGDRFCVRCGKALPIPASDSSGRAEQATCPSCGAALHEGDRFCARCGQTLRAEEDT